MSQRWLNWCSAPEAGRLVRAACIAKPLIIRPTTSRRRQAGSPRATRPGESTQEGRNSCTVAQAAGSIGSSPATSARIQWAPATPLASRSAYPDWFIPGGARAITSRSASTARGAEKGTSLKFTAGMQPDLGVEKPHYEEQEV